VERIGKLFRVEGANRRCLGCGQLFTWQEAPHHAQLPCRPVQNVAREERCELRSTHE
jgi:hypothetical protein